MINIYCDESCHLERDESSHMALGAISCYKNKTRYINQELRRLKAKNGISTNAELKWSKVNKGKIDYYLAVCDYFFDNPYLRFRTVIADKTILRHGDFNQSHDMWYYKMYFLLLRELVNTSTQYKIYIDIKDTQGGQKVDKLKEILNNSLYAFYNEVVRGVQQINSRESEILQVVDFLIGAVCYENRGITSSNAKLQVINHIKERSGFNLKTTTTLSENKFNIFVWRPKGDNHVL